MGNYYLRLLESARKWPDLVALEMRHASGKTEQYTFRELQQLSDSIGHWVCANVTRGARCAILAANSPRWVAAYMGTLAAGAITVPFDTALNPDQVRKLLLDSGSSILFTDVRNRPAAEQAAAGLNIRLVSLDSDVASLSAGDTFTAAQVASDDVAAILYSSGTTGDPKGVMLTHANLAAETNAIMTVVNIGPADCILAILPLFHALAQVVNLLLPMASGTKIVFLDSLNTTELLKALPSVNIFVCVPQFFYLIHDRIWKEVSARGPMAQKAFRAMLAISRVGRVFHLNLGKVFFRKVHHLIGPNMRFLVTGGSKFDAAIGREFEDLGFTMLQGYGLTETTGASTYTPPGKVDIATVGCPLPGMEVKIDNPQPKEGRTHPEGEICLRGGMVMKGYWNRPDATEAAIKDGWLHTGDLGFVDARGNVHITGRAKEIIVLSSGKNIYPEEIEAHYLKSPLIKEICVLGLQSKPGEPFSERLHGVIVPDFDLLREKKIVNAREVIRYDVEGLSSKLPSTKRILSYEIWQNELPRTTTRKLKRFEIERMVLERKGGETDEAAVPTTRKLAEEEQMWLADTEVQRALAIVLNAAKNKPQRIHPQDSLELDLGLDSMERVELLVALERELGSSVEDSVVSEVYTVRELVDAVRNAKGSTSRRQAAPAWDAVLAEEPTDPEVLAIEKERTVTTMFWYFLTRLGNVISKDVFRLRVEGLDKLPKEGPIIISPNHQSFLDAPVLMGALPWRLFKEVFYVGTSEIFGEGIWRMLAKSLKLIPVDPDANLVPAMRAGAFGLRRRKVLVLFPEGERSIEGTPKVFKKGAAILSAHLNAPIVPVALDGFYEAWPRGRQFQKFAKLRIRFGDPIYPAPDRKPEEQYEELTTELRSRVMRMWNELHDELYPGKAVAQSAD